MSQAEESDCGNEPEPVTPKDMDDDFLACDV